MYAPHKRLFLSDLTSIGTRVLNVLAPPLGVNGWWYLVGNLQGNRERTLSLSFSLFLCVCVWVAGFFFSAEISEISPKTGFIGGHRYFLIPNEIFWYSKNMFKF
jgi:hypothetical protein